MAISYNPRLLIAPRHYVPQKWAKHFTFTSLTNILVYTSSACRGGEGSNVWIPHVCIVCTFVYVYISDDDHIFLEVYINNLFYFYKPCVARNLSADSVVGSDMRLSRQADDLRLNGRELSTTTLHNTCRRRSSKRHQPCFQLSPNTSKQMRIMTKSAPGINLPHGTPLPPSVAHCHTANPHELTNRGAWHHQPRLDSCFWTKEKSSRNWELSIV